MAAMVGPPAPVDSAASGGGLSRTSPGFGIYKQAMQAGGMKLSDDQFFNNYVQDVTKRQIQGKSAPWMEGSTTPPTTGGIDPVPPPQPATAMGSLQSAAMPIGAGWQDVSAPGTLAGGLGTRLQSPAMQSLAQMAGARIY